MSLKSWKDEFYPVRAYKHAKTEREEEGLGPGDWKEDDPHAVLAAVDHSLLKWGGLDEKTLNDHGLRRLSSGRVIAEVIEGDCIGATAVVNSVTCALCARYEDECEDCPITEATGTPCSYMPGEYADKTSPYMMFKEHGDTAPMLDMLRRTREYVIEFFPQLQPPKEPTDAEPSKEDPDTL